MTPQDKVDLFFSRALPVAHRLTVTQAVMWWAYQGELVRVAFDAAGLLDVDLVEPDSADMDDLLRECSADDLCDAIAVSKLRTV